MHEASKAQATFKKVIDGGYYANGVDKCQYMCWALGHALIGGVITSAEHMEAYDEIHMYLAKIGGWSIMYRALRDMGLAPEGYDAKTWAFEFGRDFYLNWDSRPVPA